MTWNHHRFTFLISLFITLNSCPYFKYFFTSLIQISMTPLWTNTQICISAPKWACISHTHLSFVFLTNILIAICIGVLCILLLLLLRFLSCLVLFVWLLWEFIMTCFEHIHPPSTALLRPTSLSFPIQFCVLPWPHQGHSCCPNIPECVTFHWSMVYLSRATCLEKVCLSFFGS